MTTILIVDDEASVRTSIAYILRHEKYDVLEASDGQQGLEIARVKLPALILSDIMMPRLDGYGFLLALKENPVTALIPFIFLTGQSQYNDMRRGMSFGADDYLVKPVSLPDLISAVQSRLEKQAIMMRTQEERLDAIRNSVVTMLPHELLTPLTGIMGYVDLIIDDYASIDPDYMVVMLQRVQRASRRLHRLIQNYILYTQLELVGISEQRLKTYHSANLIQPTNPAEISAPVIQTRAEFYTRSADVQLSLAPFPIRCLRDDYVKILEELIDNAFKFSKPGTPVSIQGKTVENGYEIVIEDGGRGMTPEQIASIGPMIQFERAHYEQQGSGLGLTIARRLIDIYGGSLRLESDGKTGCQVTIHFLAAEVPV